METPRTQGSDGVALSWPAEDQECLALLKRLIAETQRTIAQSRAAIDWSREAIALLVRLQGPQVPN
jgi:hypothetical protein